LKLHFQASSAFYNTFTGYGEGYVEINQKRYEESLVVMPEGVLELWPVDRLAALEVRHFARVLELGPEIVIFGSGSRLRFVNPALTAPLIDSGVGIETMDTHAACRTYNVLMSEGRRVACALLIERPAGAP
jgi:uncharacterized protein